MWALIVYSDTTPTRFMLALAATYWTVFLCLPGETMGRPVYVYMASVARGLFPFGDPDLTWAAFWAVHATGMWWRTFSSVPRPAMALAINSLGVLLFTTACIAITMTLTFPFPAAVAPDVVLAMASCWVLVRTSINSDSGWRVD